MDPPHLDRFSPAESKIALFRSLFRGRDDVYARWFENRRTEKSGYSPACANERAQGICEKPRIKCTACPHQRFLPVTDDASAGICLDGTLPDTTSSWVSILYCGTKPASFW